jgi:hypothetical protein
VEILLPRHETGRRAHVRLPVSRSETQVVPAEVEAARLARSRAPRGTKAGRMVSRISRASFTLARALVGQPGVGREDSGWMLAIAIALLITAVAGFFAPRVLAWPLAFALFWIGVASLYRAYAQWRQR